MNVVGVEFDRTKYETTVECEDYLNSFPDLMYLMERKTFRMKSTISRFMSDENRKIWSWYDLWQCKEIKVERPNAYVVILRRIGSDQWERSDTPIPLESTQEKRRKLDLLRQKREVNKKEAVEKLKTKRKAQASTKKPKKPKKAKTEASDPLADPNPALQALLKEKEHEMNGQPLSPIGINGSDL